VRNPLLFAPQPVACYGPGPLSLGLTLLTLPPCRYYGDRTGRQSSLSSLLGFLLDSDLDRLPAILESLSKGLPWRGTVLVRASLHSRPPDSSVPTGIQTDSPSAILTGLSRSSVVLCSQGPDTTADSAAALVQAPKLRWLMESIGRTQSCLEASDVSSPQCIGPKHPSSLKAMIKASSFSRRKAPPTASCSLEHEGTLAELKAAPAAAPSPATSDELLPLPTMPPAIALRGPGPKQPSNLARQRMSLEVMRAILPNASRPRFDENSVVAALGSSSTDMPTLLEALQSQSSAQHRPRTNIILSPEDTAPWEAVVAPEGAETSLFSGLFGLAGMTEVRTTAGTSVSASASGEGKGKV
jgi:hypothetical protein